MKQTQALIDWFRSRGGFVEFGPPGTCATWVGPSISRGMKAWRILTPSTTSVGKFRFEGRTLEFLLEEHTGDQSVFSALRESLAVLMKQPISNRWCACGGTFVEAMLLTTLEIRCDRCGELKSE